MLRPFFKRVFSFLMGQRKEPKRLHNLKGEAYFLAGRHTPIKETLRLIRIAFEFIRGFRAFQNIGPAVTVFGSARFKEGTRYYDLTREVARLVALEGFTIVTGGGPGVMEAANRGAQEARGLSVGVNVILPHEQHHNPYLDKVVTFYYFFVRKVMLIKYSYAYIIMPGGFGTLDEMTEALTLIQTGKIYDFPIIMVGRDYWKGFLDWANSTLVEEKAINPADLAYLKITDDPKEVVRILRDCTQNLGLSLHPPKAQARVSEFDSPKNSNPGKIAL